MLPPSLEEVVRASFWTVSKLLAGRNDRALKRRSRATAPKPVLLASGPSRSMGVFSPQACEVLAPLAAVVARRRIGGGGLNLNDCCVRRFYGLSRIPSCPKDLMKQHIFDQPHNKLFGTEWIVETTMLQNANGLTLSSACIGLGLENRLSYLWQTCCHGKLDRGTL